MAELERLIQRLEADTSQFHAALRTARNDIGQLDATTTRSTRAMTTGFAGAGRAVTAFRGLLAGLGATLSVRQVLSYADAYTDVQNALRYLA